MRILRAFGRSFFREESSLVGSESNVIIEGRANVISLGLE
jgi:hypothetical protein